MDFSLTELLGKLDPVWDADANRNLQVYVAATLDAHTPMV